VNSSPEFIIRKKLEILVKAQKEYIYWDKFKYYPFPKGIKPEEAWSYLKISARATNEKTPIQAIDGSYFAYSLPKTLYQKLNFIDTHGAGLIKSMTGKPSEVQAAKYIISSLTEEAIASSQIEGANTTHKVAKEMILSERKPRNKDEQMIVNNYRAMQKIEEWKDLDLTERMLIDLQIILTDQTMEDESDSGRFRKDSDEIVVHDPLTGEIVYTPPKEKMMVSELKKLIQYANTEEDDDEFIHPVIKATILHFWLAYLHPFVDGNGRSARAIFYWYLLKRNYWLIQYVSVSRSIKQSRTTYDNVYLQSEHDDNDLTYFILYVADAFKKAILQFLEHFEKKEKEAKELEKAVSVLRQFNVRQITLLKHFAVNSADYTDVITHQNKHAISRATANNDLRYLTQEGYVTEVKRGKKLVYMPNMAKIKKIFPKK
jgi:Fic family protein